MLLWPDSFACVGFRNKTSNFCKGHKREKNVKIKQARNIFGINKTLDYRPGAFRSLLFLTIFFSCDTAKESIKKKAKAKTADMSLRAFIDFFFLLRPRRVFSSSSDSFALLLLGYVLGLVGWLVSDAEREKEAKKLW